MVSLVRRSRPLQVLEGSQGPSLISSCFVVVICHRVVLRCVSGLGDMGASHAGGWRPRLRGRTLDPPAASVSEEVGRDYAAGNEALSESRRAESDSLIVGSHTGSRDLPSQVQKPQLRVWPRVRVLAHQLSPKHRVQPSARTFCSPFHDGHCVLHHVSGATVAAVRSMSPRSSLLRAVCLHPLAHTSRWSLGFKRRTSLCQHATDIFHQQKKHLRRQDEKKNRTPYSAGSQPSGILRRTKKNMKFNAFLRSAPGIESLCGTHDCHDHDGHHITQQCHVNYNLLRYVHSVQLLPNANGNNPSATFAN